MNVNFDEAVVILACVAVGASIAYNIVPLTIALLIVLLVLAYKGKISVNTRKKDEKEVKE